jgi:hypothetical protein
MLRWSYRDWGLGRELVGAAAFTEAVTHHAEGKQRKDERQEDHKKEASKPERGWLFFFKAGRIRISLH